MSVAGIRLQRFPETWQSNYVTHRLSRQYSLTTYVLYCQVFSTLSYGSTALSFCKPNYHWFSSSMLLNPSKDKRSKFVKGKDCPSGVMVPLGSIINQSINVSIYNLNPLCISRLNNLCSVQGKPSMQTNLGSNSQCLCPASPNLFIQCGFSMFPSLVHKWIYPLVPPITFL